MRIIGGQAGGRLLQAPKGLAVRPMPDLVKQAVFNSLGARVMGSRVLELFAGSGAVGLECLSRGAASLECVELSRRHAEFIRHNLQVAGLSAHPFSLRVQNAFTALPQLAAAQRRFDLVFADPPFGEKNTGRRSTSLAQQLLDDLSLPRLIAPEGLFILGHSKRDRLSLPAAWRETKCLKHGDSIARFLSSCAPEP